MDLRTLFDKAQSHYQSGRPFVLFMRPNTSLIQSYFQQGNEEHVQTTDVNEGFVFADFSGNQQLMILKETSECYAVSVDQNKAVLTPSSLTDRILTKEKEAHLNLVKQGIHFVKSGASEKVVLSRCEQIELPRFSIEASFRYIIDNYKNAMCYVWFHPATGIWLGATPETLLSIERNQLITMSLAGTQPFRDQQEFHWGQKERKEQGYVTDYIAQILKKLFDEVSISEPYTVRAGNLLHLQTDLKAELKGFTDIFGLVGRLHPTPAVCGVPKESSLNFIKDQEGYNREFYTGYLGEINGLDSCDLYVNLRCVKIKGSKASIYVGGGITSDSNPEDEWLETVEKSKVIKKALAVS